MQNSHQPAPRPALPESESDDGKTTGQPYWSGLGQPYYGLEGFLAGIARTTVRRLPADTEILKLASIAMWLTLYHYASCGVVFSLEGSKLSWDPSTMKADDWVQLINYLWQEFQKNISVAKQIEYAHLQAAYQVKAPVPFELKAKAVVPQVPPVGKGAHAIKQHPQAAVGKAAEAKGGCNGKDKKEAKARKPRSPADKDVSVCVADLLQHYGAANASSCSYVHYKSIPPGTAKDAILGTLKYLRKAFDLTDNTVQLMTKKISADPKFK